MEILMVLLVALLPIVFSAPVAVEKRSKEVILFGNHQNKPRVPFASKKSDPEFVSANPDLVDQQGSVHVVTSEDVNDVNNAVQTEPVSEPDTSLADVANVEGQSQSEDVLDSVIKDLEQVNNEKIDVKPSVVEEIASEAVVPNVEPDAAAAVVDAALDGIQTDSNVNEVAEAEKGVPDTGDILDESNPSKDDLEDFYEYLLSYNNANQNLPSSSQNEGQYSDYWPNLYSSMRRKRSSHTSLTQGSHKTLKRARRIKRDLLDDKALYLNQYPVQERLPSDEELYQMFHSTAQNLQDLADLLDLYTEYQAPEPVAPPPYAAYEPYETYPTKDYDDEEENDLFSPVKREMLSSLPGMKKRLFYPSYEEPATHWGPFVAEQKRDDVSQEESYQRLLMLAQALAGEEPSSYYYDGYYKKK